MSGSKPPRAITRSERFSRPRRVGKSATDRFASSPRASPRRLRQRGVRAGRPRRCPGGKIRGSRAPLRCVPETGRGVRADQHGEYAAMRSTIFCATRSRASSIVRPSDRAMLDPAGAPRGRCATSRRWACEGEGSLPSLVRRIARRTRSPQCMPARVRRLPSSTPPAPRADRRVPC